MRGGPPGRSPYLTLSLLLSGPLLVFLAVVRGLSPGGSGSAPEAVLEGLARRLQARFEEVLTGAADVADAALVSVSSHPQLLARPGRLPERIEGIGILGPNLAFLSWSGTPTEPDPDFGDPARPRFRIHVDGVRTRLVVRAGPDDQGRFTLVSMILDSTLDDRAFGGLLSDDLRQRMRLKLDFGGALDAPAEDRVFLLRSPDQDVLARASLVPVPADVQAARARRIGLAWSAITCVLLGVALVRWRAWCESRAGLAAVAAALAGARWLLWWQEVPARLLPRELGAPSLYGSSAWGGLLSSPADLLLTTAALYALCLACRQHATRRPQTLDRGALAPLSALLALLYGLAAWALTHSLARNSRVPLIDRPAPFEWDGRLVLWLGLILLLLATAEWIALAATLRRARGSGPTRVRRIPVALLFLGLVGLATELLQSLTERAAVEQLSTEFAPWILEQSSRRQVALLDAMREIRDRVGREDPVLPTPGSDAAPMAFRYWVDGELFRSGYRSSLDFYSPAGERISHFQFDLPLLQPEPLQGLDPAERDPLIRAEFFDEVVSVQQRALHAEMPLSREGSLLGVVVGHVLDEPDNLPFLPRLQPYLAALGPGVPRLDEVFAGRLQYVLYDEFGAVVLTTLLQPPAQSGILRGAAEHGEPIRVEAGDRLYVGLAIDEDGERLHLLLIPAPGLLERLAEIVRVALLGWLVLVGLGLGLRLFRRGGLAELAGELRGSFYRRLLAALLLASVLPLVGLALFLRGYVEHRADAALIASATQFVSAAQRVLEDYSTTQFEEESQIELNDAILYWLSSVVGQEIHVYRDGLLEASSKRELFASGLLPLRLDGDVYDRLVGQGLPHEVVDTRIGPATIPVAYAPVRLGGVPQRVVAVPLILEEQQIAADAARVREMILLSTVVLMGLLAVVAAFLARTVAGPVRALVEATGRIASGDYGTRLEPQTRDEVAQLVRGFNTMAAALAHQRADLERRREYVETLLRHDTTGVISIDASGRVVTVNPAAHELLEGARLVLAPGVDLVRELSAHDDLRPLAAALGSTAPGGDPVEIDLERAHGRRRIQVVRVELPADAGGSVGTLVLLDDVTDLMRSNQLAAWAEMARVIAHEIKNPLTPIQLSADHLRRLLADRGLSSTPEIERCLSTITKQVRSLYQIAGEFSTYARLPDIDPKPRDPVEFVRSTLEPYKASPPPGLEIVESYEPAPEVALDQRALSRALINLVENALQAMPEGGRLSVSVRHDRQARQVVLSVGDSGVGLDPALRPRLFEPYFSTKSSGTGLGLAIVRRAVESHGGSIDVESEPGHGTTFHIRLPVILP